MTLTIRRGGNGDIERRKEKKKKGIGHWEGTSIRKKK